jgi:predicted phage terminase large subunit-like protein
MPTDHQRLHALRTLQWRRICQRDFLSFAIHVLSPRGESPARHHQRICSELQAVARGAVKRLMIPAPPGSAKTTYVSRLFIAWYLATHPHASLIGLAYRGVGRNQFRIRAIRDNFDVLGLKLSNDAKSNWETDNGGRYRAIGVGGAVTGFRADIVIIDDPIRGRMEADSTIARAHTWDWYCADLLTRLKPEGAIVLIATPYHEDDLMGRLLRIERDAWRVLRLPAVAEENDPLGRPEGEPLWSDDRAYGYGARLLALRDQYEREGVSRDWYSQYQCRPRPPEGAMFKPGQMPVLEFLPPLIKGASVRAWDLASSSTGDYTVGLKLSLRAEDRLPLVTDVRRMRGRPDEVRRLVKTVAEADGRDTKIMLPRDPAQAGQDQADSYVQLLAGFRVEAVRMSGSKEIRADAVASQVNIGRVGMLRAAWNGALIDELGAFPLGPHDDQVDALALAFSKTTAQLQRWPALGRWPRDVRYRSPDKYVGLL